MNSAGDKALVNYGFSQGDIGQFNTEFNNSHALVRTIMGSTDTQTLNTSVLVNTIILRLIFTKLRMKLSNKRLRKQEKTED
jgi:hypothetical protein